MPTNPATVRASPTTRYVSHRSRALRLSGVQAAPTSTSPWTVDGWPAASRTAAPPDQLWATTVAGTAPAAAMNSAISSALAANPRASPADRP